MYYIIRLSNKEVIPFSKVFGEKIFWRKKWLFRGGIRKTFFKYI